MASAMMAAYAAQLEKARIETPEAVAGVRNMDEAALDAPTPEAAPELFRERFPAVRDSPHQIISHDSYHLGQLALLGKHAG